jgi:predicted small secreted protein
MVLRWILILKIAGALTLGAIVTGGTTGCGTIEGFGKDISDAARYTRRAFE